MYYRHVYIILACVLVAGAAPESVIVLMLRRRATDEKVGVRKTALLALEGIIRLNITNISRDVSFLLVHALYTYQVLRVSADYYSNSIL